MCSISLKSLLSIYAKQLACSQPPQLHVGYLHLAASAMNMPAAPRRLLPASCGVVILLWGVRLRKLEDRLDIDPENTRVAFQGFGNAAYHCARLLHEDGFTIVGVSDSSGAIYDPDGMDPEKVLAYKKQEGSVVGAPTNGKGVEIDGADLLTCDCDVLAPAALEDQITCDNANDIQASVILELANGPTSFDADDLLLERGIVPIPDILANAGGVTVSYFEWVQNRAGDYWTAETVRDRLKEKMETEAENVWDLREAYDVGLRGAAYIHALKRLNDAISARGTKEYFNGDEIAS